MSNVFIENSTLTSIANAIRSRNSSNELYLPAQMGDEILTLSTGLDVRIKTWDSNDFSYTSVSGFGVNGITIFIDGVCDITFLSINFIASNSPTTITFKCITEDTEKYNAFVQSSGMSAAAISNPVSFYNPASGLLTKTVGSDTLECDYIGGTCIGQIVLIKG